MYVMSLWFILEKNIPSQMTNLQGHTPYFHFHKMGATIIILLLIRLSYPYQVNTMKFLYVHQCMLSRNPSNLFLKIKIKRMILQYPQIKT